MTDSVYDSNEGEFIDFETLDEWEREAIKRATRNAELEAENARLRGALGRIIDASDYYGRENTYHDRPTLAYAHQSTCRLARAALTGEVQSSSTFTEGHGDE